MAQAIADDGSFAQTQLKLVRSITAVAVQPIHAFAF
jgi:hypothetical protein